ncbi:hypothetical protein B0T17DRAFT_34908 [Bombardia bombarda]|uniref:Uncharacterized protein n=1 Tax=Bombardia bombarda TaxID=252184 RepID=A0AA40CF79_9PEZI|nr:hypothetical protein B0T17DRAFT_34908 [Bombardia bombarda]
MQRIRQGTCGGYIIAPLSQTTRFPLSIPTFFFFLLFCFFRFLVRLAMNGSFFLVKSYQGGGGGFYCLVMIFLVRYCCVEVSRLVVCR